MPSGNYILAELVVYIKAGAGQVNEKEHWINAVNQSMNKLRNICEEDFFLLLLCVNIIAVMKKDYAVFTVRPDKLR
jgi:hypothetical protein